MDKFLLSAFLVLFIGVNTGHSQTLNQFLEKGDESFETGYWHAAMRYYEVALEFDESQVDVWRRYAQSAMKLKAYAYADTAFQMVVNNDATDKASIYWLAYTKHRQGKYEEAEMLYDRFLQEMPDSLSALGDLADVGIENCRYAIVELEMPKDLNIRHLDTLINTPDSEFAPSVLGDTLYYSSLNFLYEKDKHIPPRPYAKVLNSINEAPGVLLPKGFNVEGRHVANMAFNEDRSLVFYTVCDYRTDDDLKCDLYYQQRLPDGQWAGANILNLNQYEYTSTHPTVGWDKEADQEILYFVSDRPGGKGGKDIWAAYIDEEGQVGDPFNLEGINTPNDDITPFFHTPSQRLYFSSDGYETYGGFDIYNVQKQGFGWSEPYNMGAPLNSSYDEKYYFRSDCSDGYFASNREGSIYLIEAKETCCDDIYAVVTDLGIELEAFTFNSEDNNNLEGATIKIYEVGNDQDPVAEIKNPTSNDFSIQLERCKEYTIVTSRPGFSTSTIPLNLSEFGGEFGDDIPSEFDYPKKVKKDIYLDPIKVLLVVKPCGNTDDGAVPLFGVRALLNLIDDESGDLTLVAEKENSMDDPDMIFTAYLNKQYQLVLRKEGYLERTDTIIITDADYEEYGERIILEGCLEQDPFPDIRLFFDNDVPGNHPNDATIAIYNELLDTYIGRKEEYIENFTIDLPEDQKFTVGQVSRNFFERDVTIGRAELNRFAVRLQKFLEMGHHFEINIRGYASPRGKDEYNELLSSRRITSVLNYLDSFENGALKPFQESGQLNIRTENYGESTAAADISDELRDRKNSIFSVIASVERRVEIIVKKLEVPNVKEE